MLRIMDGGPKISNEIVAEFERRNDMRLPRVYREFLLAHNGGRPERDLLAVPGCKASPIARISFFYGIGGPLGFECYDLDWNVEWYADRLGEGLLSIASTEGSDKICMSLPSGGIVFWDGYEHVPVYPVAQSFEELVENLYRDADSPEFAPSI
jgi:SMI1-KNR4 cell-wall